jgi:ABC-2 type transport system ATP-binding protein
VRELIRRLGNEGRTVYVSSHILSEVRQTCDRVAILSRGRCVAQGPVGRVLEGGRATGLLVRVDDGPRAAAILNGAGIEATDNDGRLRVGVSPSDGARVTKVLADAGVYLSELRPDEEDLEEVFLRLTQEERSE